MAEQRSRRDRLLECEEQLRVHMDNFRKGMSELNESAEGRAEILAFADHLDWPIEDLLELANITWRAGDHPNAGTNS